MLYLMASMTFLPPSAPTNAESVVFETVGFQKAVHGALRICPDDVGNVAIEKEAPFAFIGVPVKAHGSDGGGNDGN